MRKIGYRVILALLILSLTGCNSGKIDQLNDQVMELQQQNETVQKEADGLKDIITEKDKMINGLKNEIEAMDTLYDISIEEIQFISDEMYKEGEATGAIYGNFNVKVKIKNNTKQDIENIKVIGQTEISYSNYSKPPKVTAKKLEVIKNLAPTEEVEIFFAGFNVVHPETIQEMVVNVIDRGEISKLRIPSAFPPGSQD